MIYVGIDDTDAPDTRGTNKLARALAARLAGRWTCWLIVRHQLLYDPRVPYTSKNSAASLLLESDDDWAVDPLISELREGMYEDYIEGSDPGLCVTTTVPSALTEFGRRCQQDLVKQQEARTLAAQHGVYLEGLGGTDDGVIGALAAVGLAAGGDDGRIVQIGAWPDDLSGWQDVDTLQSRGVGIRCLETGNRVTTGRVDVGKHLRPNYRENSTVLFVRPESSESDHWQSVRFT